MGDLPTLHESECGMRKRIVFLGLGCVAAALAAQAQQAPAGIWTRVAGQDGSFHVAGTQTVRFGAANQWKQRTMTGPNQWCTTGMFGGDPAPGVKKTCEVFTASGTAPTTPAPTPPVGATWVKVAGQDGPFNLAGTHTVRYGAGTQWVQRTMTGPNQWCTTPMFGVDPAPGVPNVCERYVASGDVTPPKPPVIDPPVVDMPPGHGKDPLPPASVGFSTQRIMPTSELPTPGQNPEFSGEFRIACSTAHFDFNDQIIYPGQARKSHLHTFFGATTRALTLTADDLSNSNTTCNGGTGVNHSKYWVPSVIDMRTGAPVTPDSNVAYYKTGFDGVRAADIQPIPRGLRIVAGDPRNTAPLQWGGAYRWRCFEGTVSKPRTEAGLGDTTEASHKGMRSDCQVGTDLLMEVFFPQCWDGVNLDSPDHKSHMAYANNGCPASHPKALPQLTFNIHYRVKNATESAHWRLSSDVYQGQAGYSGHGDVIFAWNESIMDRIVKNCHRKGADCHAHLLGDGFMIY